MKNKLHDVSRPDTRVYVSLKMCPPYSLYVLMNQICCFTAQCKFVFDAVTLQWKFQQTECGTIVSFYVDLVYSVALFAVVTILDLVTLLRLRQARTVSGL